MDVVDKSTCKVYRRCCAFKFPVAEKASVLGENPINTFPLCIGVLVKSNVYVMSPRQYLKNLAQYSMGVGEKVAAAPTKWKAGDTTS
jgi:hypothetical protein